MAYLRWLFSDWYVYWLAGDVRSRAEEVLVVEHVAKRTQQLTYPEVKGRLDGGVSDPELAEAFRSFVADVNEEWAKKGEGERG